MYRLTSFELQKIWRKPVFLLSVAVLMMVNFFLLWYTNLSDSNTPPLSSYKEVQQDLKCLSETEKRAFINKLYEDVNGAVIVRDIINLRNNGAEMGKALEKKMMAENPGVFQKYYKQFTSGKYLRYTQSLEQELTLITELYKEAEKVFSYNDYLKDIEKRKEMLTQVSVFSGGSHESFSSRNILKEAADYQNLSFIQPRFSPSKSITASASSGITDLLLILSVFLFATMLIYEEKEKKLFFITKATPAGRGKTIGAKLSALVVHCFATTILFYGTNFIYFSAAAGTGNLTLSLQSIAPFISSSLPISVIGFLLLSLMTKALVMAAIGTFLVYLAIIGKQHSLCYLVGTGLLSASWLLYLLVPASGSANWFKYLNPVGLLQTEAIYGAYLNFNFFGHPISRLWAAWIVLILYGTCAGLLAVKTYLQSRNWEMRRLRLPRLLHVQPYVNLYRHEGYKILIMNRALVILLAFTLLFGYQHLSKSYTLSPSETYYQNIMTQLSGNITEEKVDLIKVENQRYEKAFQSIDRIDAMVASGKLSPQDGENLKSPYYSDTAFYPAFQQVLSQYDYVKKTDEKFVYDTGYQLLFGFLDNNRLQSLILLASCIIFAFSAVFSMEYRDKSWNLLAATVRGKSCIYHRKVLCCIGSILPVFLAGWVFQFLQISRSFPIEQLTASTMGLHQFREIGLDMPLILMVVLILSLQLLVLICMLMITLSLSDWLKNHMQALFSSVLLLMIPLILCAMGLTFAKWFTLLPIFDAGNTILAGHGQVISLGYCLIGCLSITGSILLLKKKAQKH